MADFPYKGKGESHVQPTDISYGVWYLSAAGHVSGVLLASWLFLPHTYLLTAKSHPELHSELPSNAPVERKESISQSDFLLPTLLLQKPQLHSSLSNFSLS